MNADSAETARPEGGGSLKVACGPASSSVVGRTRRPPLARVAKAVVISRRVTSDVPSASDGTAFDPHRLRHPHDLPHADLLREQGRRHIERLLEGAANRHRAVEPPVDIVGRPVTADGGNDDRLVRDHAGGGEAVPT